jgi:hypothetical protein
MVKPKLLDVIQKELSINQIVKAIDDKGNWLHHNWCQLPYYQYKKGCRNIDKCINMRDS